MLQLSRAKPSKWPLKCHVTQWGGGGVYGSTQISVMEVYGTTSLALRGGGGIKFPDKSVT